MTAEEIENTSVYIFIKRCFNDGREIGFRLGLCDPEDTAYSQDSNTAIIKVYGMDKSRDWLSQLPLIERVIGPYRNADGLFGILAEHGFVQLRECLKYEERLWVVVKNFF